MDKFEEEIAILTERKATMGIEEFLPDLAEKKGRKEGKEEGIEQGIEKGRLEGISMTAAKMKQSGLDIALIASIAGLSVEEIKKMA